MSNNFEIKLERVRNKLNKFIKINNKKIEELSKEDLEKFVTENFKTINSSSFYTNIRCLNQILKDNEIDIEINSKQYVKKCVKIKDEQYFTKREIQNICNTVLNYQDKFAIYGLWSGIYGKNCLELLNIKTKDVAEDYSYINLPSGKRFICDDFMKRLLRGIVNECEYRKYITSDEILSGDINELNMESEYLLKGMQTPRNNLGRNPLSLAALQRRFQKIEELYESVANEKVILNCKSLYMSGIMFDMFIQENENNKIWTVEETDKYLKLHGINMNADNLRKKYHKRYHDTEMAER